MKSSNSVALVVAGALAVSSSAQAAATFYLRNEISLNNLGLVGSGAAQLNGNPASLAISGSTVYVAGGAGSGRIATINNVLGTPAVGPVFGTATGGTASGYTGLAVSGNLLVGVESNGGAPRIRAFDVPSISAGYTGLWTALPAAVGAARFDAVAIDPGFGGLGSGVAVGPRATSQRGLLNSADGSSIYNITGENLGFSWSTTVSDVRDFAFDPATGDIYVRTERGVWAGTRTGANSIVQPTAPGNAGGAQIVTLTQNVAANNNLAFLSDIGSSDLLILNDKAAGGFGAVNPFLSVVKGFTTAGTAETLSFFNADGTLPFAPTSATVSNSGIFDFAWDAASETLAVSDFSNNRVYVFSTQAIPEPSGLAGLGLVAAGLLTRRRVR